MKQIKSFGPGAYIVDAEGVEHPAELGMEVFPDDTIVGDIEIEEVADAPADDIAALQEAILAGIDPTQVAEATAAGAPAAGQGPQEGGGSTFVALDRTKGEIDPTAGYPTGTFTVNYEDPEDEVPATTSTIALANPLEEEVIPSVPSELPVDQTIEPKQDQVPEQVPVEPEEEPPVDEGEDPVPEQPEDPVDDNSDEEDSKDEQSDPEDEEDETDPETDGPESEDDESDEDNDEGEGDQTDEDEEDDPEEQDSGNSEDDVDEPEDDDSGESEDDSEEPGSDPEDTGNSGANNGWGNGDQSAPGNSGDNNNAENSDADVPPGILKKEDLLDDEDTLDDLLPGNSGKDNAGPKGNNGWGNGDDEAPGNSLENNNAENNLDGLLSPTEQFYE